MKKIILFGAGIYGKKALAFFGADNVECFADNRKAGDTFCSKKIISFEQMQEMKDFFKVVVASEKYKDVLIKQLEKNNIFDYFIYDGKYGEASYAQAGEDRIVNYIFYELKIEYPQYLDLGANHPYKLNNTYYFYKKGCNGVLVEPDPEIYTELKSFRGRDICLNIGVGVDSQENCDFYVMSSRTLNTFSKKTAESYCSYGTEKIEKILSIPLVSVNDIIEKNFEKCPEFISIDVEGLDYEIIKSINWKQYRPQVVCIETMVYTEDKTEIKLTEIINYMKNQGYFVYADTFINTIFVDKEAWKNR